MATKSKKLTEDHFPKDLNPKHQDTKYLGNEPLFIQQPDSDRRLSAMSWAFHWYNQFYDKKTAKELLEQYCTSIGMDKQATLIRKVADSEIDLTLCWLSRMARRGLELTEMERNRLHAEIVRLIETTAKPEVVVKGDEEEISRRPNIQEIMKEKARDAAGELEGLFDEFVLSNAKLVASTRVIDEVSKHNVMPQHINIIVDKWESKLDEFQAAYEGKDKELLEGYKHYSKTQLKSFIKFIETVINDLHGYVSIKKAAKTPRARKAVPVEKIVKNLKYLKTFEDQSLKLNLTSVHPTKIHGASEAWVYDTAKRKLHHYVADEYSKTFTVKGNTLLGFCKTNSEVKTLRKPAEQIKEVMGSKPAARKYFKDIKSVAVVPNGRFNENMIILKAW